ncbi:hypothetical protein [Nitratireductor aquibiodomus]|uniref:hypothetical protein n=1 Tax=Nitratireductor aquibiodomus TaxID=204799 RepID=UPI00046A4E17|nr:hypothetical protein [Nitratireductor aquibiodomus]
MKSQTWLATQLRLGGHGTSRNEVCPFGGEIIYTRETMVPLQPVSLICVHNGGYRVEEIREPETA